MDIVPTSDGSVKQERKTLEWQLRATKNPHLTQTRFNHQWVHIVDPQPGVRGTGKQVLLLIKGETHDVTRMMPMTG